MFLETVDSYNINNAQTKESSITPTSSHGKAENVLCFQRLYFLQTHRLHGKKKKKAGRGLHDFTHWLAESCCEGVKTLLFVNQSLQVSAGSDC